MKQCSNCYWLDEFTDHCDNDDSVWYGNLTCDDDVCDCWEGEE